MVNSISTKVSLVIRLFDDYDSKPIINGIFIHLNDCYVKPIKKDGGYYIFTNLQEQIYKIQVKSEEYFEEVLDINISTLDVLNPVINIRLKPKLSFFFKKEGHIVKVQLLNKENNRPVEDAAITGIIDTKGYFIGQIIDEKLKHSQDEMLIEEFHGNLFEGESVYIQSSKKEKNEIITISHKHKKNSYKLINSIKYSHVKGEKLKKAVITRSDENGFALIYFKNLLVNENIIKIIINSNGVFKEVIVKADNEGTVKLGKIFI